MENIIHKCICKNKSDKFIVTDEIDEVAIYIYGKSDTSEAVIRIRQNPKLLLTTHNSELDDTLEDIQEIINDAIDLYEDDDILHIIKDGIIIVDYCMTDPEILIKTLRDHSPHLQEDEPPVHWFIVNETVINDKGYLYCPNCGRRYKYEDNEITLAPLPATYTHCIKCGKVIDKVDNWTKAICEDERCKKLLEEQITSIVVGD